VWPWSLTSWPQSRPFYILASYLCQLVSKSVYSFSKYRVHTFGNRRTNEQVENSARHSGLSEPLKQCTKFKTCFIFSTQQISIKWTFYVSLTDILAISNFESHNLTAIQRFFPWKHLWRLWCFFLLKITLEQKSEICHLHRNLRSIKNYRSYYLTYIG